MPDPPKPETSLALVLGASEWPYHARLAKSEAFRTSADDLLAYLGDHEGLGLPIGQVKSLFDVDQSADDILGAIQQFVGQRMEEARTRAKPIRDLLIFYIGHGGFSASDDYYLAIRRTYAGREGSSSLRVKDLAVALKEIARSLRRYLILDCCFAASAVREFQGGAITQAVRQMTLDAFPVKGTALLCAASAKEPARTPENSRYTMFGGALLEVLKSGDPELGPTLSLEELGGSLLRRLRISYLDEAVRPEVHSPDQREGDIADLPLFPNMAHKPKALDVRIDEIEAQLGGMSAAVAKTHSEIAALGRQLMQSGETRIAALEASLSNLAGELRAAKRNEGLATPTPTLTVTDTRTRFGFPPDVWTTVPPWIREQLHRYQDALLTGLNLIGLTLVAGGLSWYSCVRLAYATPARIGNPDFQQMALDRTSWRALYALGCGYLLLCVGCASISVFRAVIPRLFSGRRPPPETFGDVGRHMSEELRSLEIAESDAIARFRARRLNRVIGGIYVTSPLFEIWFGLAAIELLVLFAISSGGGASPLSIFAFWRN